MESTNSSYINYAKASSINKGDYMMINKHPCKCVEKKTSKTGKHGGCKCHFVGIDIFYKTKHVTIYSSTDNIEIPIVKKEDYKLLDINENDDYVSLMSKLDSTNVREDVKILDNQMKIDLLNKFNSEESIICTVLTSMGISAVISYKEN